MAEFSKRRLAGASSGIGSSQSAKSLLGGTAISAYIALADLIFHLLIANNYGYFRDELYYIIAGQRLAPGYVDFPPVIALLAALMNVLGHDSLFAIHVIPAIAGSSIVFVAALIAKEFGGGRRAQILAAIATMFSASFAVASIFSMDVLDMLWWTLLAYVLVRIIKGNGKEPKLWILFGVIAGIGLMTKLTMAFFLVSLFIAFIVTSKRNLLKSIWPWIGVGIALIILSPYVIWNYVNGWPTVDFFIHHGGLNGGGPLSFLAYQFLIAGLLGIPLVIVGLFFFLRSGTGRNYSPLGIAFLVLLVVYAVTNAKPYFLMGAYPFAFAGGSILVEKASRGRKKFIWPTYLGGIILIGIILAPVYAPVLSPQTYANYYQGFTGSANGASAQQNAGIFPQYLGDRFGWNTMTATVAQVYDSLNSSDRAVACIFTSNYGEASALTFLGKSYDLPPVISGHNNYYIWGPGSCTGAVLILIDVNETSVQSSFDSVSVAGTITCQYCMATEDNLPVLLAIGLHGTLSSLWPSLKDFS
jgi:4-amino-4-deoxy-L-arabinose transferase-like glycosyltransferase